RKNKEVEKFEKAEKERLGIAKRFQQDAANIAANMGGVLGANTGDKTNTPEKPVTDRSVEAASSMYQKIADLRAEYDRKSMTADEAEIQAVIDKFQRVEETIEKFNKDPKNKIKVDVQELREIRDK